jgi:hypothetical protein
MNGGFSRPIATWLIPVALVLTSLAGCSLFAPPPAPIVEPVAAPAPAASDADAASAAAAIPASTPSADEVAAPDSALHVLQKTKRLIKRIIKPKPVVVAPPPPPAVPAPIITIEVVPRDQARGLLDSEVQRPNGKVIGRAVDMLVDANGKPLEVVINLSGFMGVGDIKTNFPWSEFHFSPAAHKAPVTLTFGSGDSMISTQTRLTQAPATNGTAAGNARPTLQLMDNAVQDMSGAKVGRVVDVLIDEKAQPQAIVFDVGNSIGPNRHNIAATWKAARFVMKDKVLQLQMDLNDAQIKAAPPYVSDQPARVIAPVAVAPAPVAPPAIASSAAAHNPR